MNGAGTLWFCNPKLTLLQNVEQAATWYKRHFGLRPNVVQFNPAEKPAVEVPGFTVRAARYRAKGEIWVTWEKPTSDSTSN